MHILIVPPSVFLTRLQPLNGIFQLHQARALSSAGNKVGVLSVGFITPRYIFKHYDYLKYENLENIRVYRNYSKLYFPWRFLSQQNICNFILRLTDEIFKEYVRKEGMPQLVHVHNFLHAGVVGEYLNLKYNIPFIVTEHSSRYENGCLSAQETALIKRISCQAKAISAVSKSFSDGLSRILQKDILLLPNLVDPAFLRLAKNEPSPAKYDNFTFFNAASLDDNKNHTLLLSCFAASFKGKAVSLRIAGEGPLLSKLKKQALAVGIADQVTFLGCISHSQIRTEMKASHCFVLSSNYETFGVVLIEALACGIPLISSACGGTTDIVNDSVGYLFEPKCAFMLSKAMEKMVGNNKAFSPDYLVRYAEENFGSEAFLINYRKLTDSFFKNLP